MILFSNFSPRLEVAYPSFFRHPARPKPFGTRKDSCFYLSILRSCQRTPTPGRPGTGKVFIFLEIFLAPQSLMGLTGLEPVTLRLSSACSNQLSYRPEPKSPVGIPKTPHAWRHGDSNPRPIACKATALPAELCPP